VKLRILVVDDSIMFRKVVTDAISGIPGVEIVGTAANGRIALSKIKSLKPDLLTLDLEMPEMDGLELLEVIRDEKIGVGTILISCLSANCGDLTMKGLELGAFDYVPKLTGTSPAEDVITIRKSLEVIFKAFKRQQQAPGIRRGTPAPLSVASARLAAPYPVAPSPPVAASPGKRTEAIAIGISTGGPKALTDMMVALPARLGVPLFIVQHMPPLFTASLADNLNSRCPFLVKEAENGEAVLANTAYIAPGGRQMSIVKAVNGPGRIIRITDDPPENNCRPSVDYLFRSIAEQYPGRATGVIMTGMGNDGALGAKVMKQNGALIIAQNQETSVVYGMPKAVVDMGCVDLIVPLDRIAGEIVKSLGPA
jgi:two-component system, chemotaxis family, protein-glutamate methylesterase/glutaminase